MENLISKIVKTMNSKIKVKRYSADLKMCFRQNRFYIRLDSWVSSDSVGLLFLPRVEIATMFLREAEI